MRQCISIVIALLVGITTTAQSQNLQTSTELSQILTELRQIHALLEKNMDKPVSTLTANPNHVPTPSLRTISLDVENSPMLGSKESPITIVEFTDFQCPFCNIFYQRTFPDLRKNYIDSGKVRFYVLNLPLGIHPNALSAAEAGKCADEQGKFWKMFDLMQSNPTQLEFKNLIAYAEKIGLNIPVFKDCLESQKYKDQIQQGAIQAQTMGARGTPAFVIGKSTPSGVDGVLFIGAENYSYFENILKGLE